MIIKEIKIDKFRAIENMTIKLGKYITAIAGRNATMKSTLLGIIGQPFTIPEKGHPLSNSSTIDGYNFKSQFSEKFKLSPEFDKVKEHRWTTYFYNNINLCDNNEFTCESIYRHKSSKSLRFWNAKGRAKGYGFVQLPVYYLSLSRLYPIGEIKRFKKTSTDLTTNETKFYIKYHKKILSNNCPDEITVGFKNSTNKMFSGLNTSSYDVLSNSAGEDNIGKIILAILSFKRLKDNYPSEYKGGILLIDEIDATLYPFSQKKLIEFLYEQAKENKIQIIFTTHSKMILETVTRMSLYDDPKIRFTPQIPTNRNIIFLKKEYKGEKKFLVEQKSVLTQKQLKEVISDINLEQIVPSSINIYFEDLVAKKFFLHLLEEEYHQYLNPIEINLGYTNYIQLHKKNVPEFHNSIIILDNDVNEKLNSLDKTYIDEKAQNILFLPIDIEKGLYHLLRNRDNYKIFKNKANLDYDICFRDYTENTLENTLEYKHWFQDLGKMINKNYSFLFDTWIELNPQQKEEFINKFKNVYNSLAEKFSLDLIY